MSAELKQAADERRRMRRQRSFLRGTIYFNDHRSVLDCLVRDFTPQGARLVFPNAVTIPDVVDLHIPQKDYRLQAQVVWRHSEEVGVVFSEIPESSQNPADFAELGQRVVRLENDIATLKRVLKKLQSDGKHDFELD